MINSRLSIFNPTTLDWNDIGLTGDIPVSVNYSVADVREPDKRNSAFSKTITIPGTKEINALFELVFEINIALQNFNPNKKTKAEYWANDQKVFVGNLQLLKIRKRYNGSNQNIVYECSIVGEANDLIVAFGDKYLTDLNFTGGYNIDHAFTWGANTTNQPATPGLGYCYPWIKYGVDTDADWTFENLKPAIFERFYL